MKTRVKYLIIFFACLVIGLITSGCTSGELNQELENLRESVQQLQAASQRALDVSQVQNTYSKHAYYHAVGLHLEELADIWVKEDGEFAETATWTTAAGIWEGMDLIKDYYGNYNLKNRQINLEAISKIYPEVENIPENIGAGSEWVMHTQTTPIIEIAGDGKTAKGMWYSPGIMQRAVIKDGKAEVSGGWFWEKYAVDFVKEDGEWKIWHIGMYYDPTPPGWGAVQEEEPFVEAGERTDDLIQPKPSKPNPDPYEGWTPTSMPRIQPKFPEPYYTFSETFSY